MDKRLKQQLDFVLEIDKEKNILRQTHLSGHGRRENDAEHAWHMAIMSYLLREYSNESVDIAKVMLMCLIHDIVEIDAGDTFAYDEEGRKTQKAREDAAKERIFSILPEDQKNELIALTKRPLYFLTAAGVINVVLNLFFVIMFRMDVAGVALATAISQAISACLVILCLMESEGSLKLHLKDLKIHRSKFRQIIQVGLPAGMQGAVFSISNVLIQSSVNSFGSVAMAGNTTSQNIEGFIYNAMNAVYQANLSFTSQNFGGKKYSRINRIMVTCLGVVTAVALGMGIPAYLCGHALIRIYSSDPEVIVYGMRRLAVFGTTYFLCGIMDTMVGSIRGLGYSVMPMCVSLLGACGLRIVWIFTVFQVYHNLTVLYLSYPFTWIVTATAHMICFYIVRRKLPREDA